MHSDSLQNNLDKEELSGRKNPDPRFRNPDSSTLSDTLIID